MVFMIYSILVKCYLMLTFILVEFHVLCVMIPVLVHPVLQCVPVAFHEGFTISGQILYPIKMRYLFNASGRFL